MDYVSSGLGAFQVLQNYQDRQAASARNAEERAIRDQELAASQQALAERNAAREADAADQQAEDDAKARALAERRAQEEEENRRASARSRAETRARLTASGVSPDSGSGLVALRNLLEEADAKDARSASAYGDELDALARMKIARDRRLALERRLAESANAQIAARRRLNLLAPAKASGRFPQLPGLPL